MVEFILSFLLTFQTTSENLEEEYRPDVIIYRFVPDANREDLSLQSFLNDLSAKMWNTIPLVVYTRGAQINFTGTTLDCLKNRGLYSLANNPISLIKNTADAYSVTVI